MNFFQRGFISLGAKGVFRWMADSTYLKILYKIRTGQKLNLNDPKTYNEKLQWLKIHNRKPEYTQMVDKYEVKRLIADQIGEKYVIPTLGVWDRFEDIDFDSLPDRFVLKCTHDSGGLVICRDKSKLDRAKAQEKIERSLNHNYYWSGREWPYKNVKPRILAEQYIETSVDKNFEENNVDEKISYQELQKKHGLLDYKFLCFDGTVRAVFLDIGVIGKGQGHAEHYYRNVYDRDGVLLPVKETRENYPVSVVLPENFGEMVEIAEKLSKNIAHIRVDLYRLDSGEIKVGELTFFHGSGLTNEFIPKEWDRTFGDWIKL